MHGKYLGKIKSAEIRLDLDDYNKAKIFFEFVGSGWGVQISEPVSESNIKYLLLTAKVNNFISLKDIPVEVTIEQGILKQYRILEEVL